MSDNVLPNLLGLALVENDEQPVARSNCILDTASGISEDGLPDVSYTATFPAMFQVDPVPTGTIVEVQARIHKNAAWIPIWTSSDPSPAYLTQWSMPYNFMRAVRTSGTGDVKAYQAMFPSDQMG